MEILNQLLTKRERNWLETMLPANMPFSDMIINQINHASITHETDPYYYSMYFQSLDQYIIPSVTFKNIEMLVYVYASTSAPMVFSLYIVKGLVQKFEIYNADFSKLQLDVNIENSKKELLVYNDSTTIGHICTPEWRMNFT